MATYSQSYSSSSTESRLSPWTWAALALTIAGALNWALQGLFRYDLIAGIFGHGSTLSRLLYTLIGLGGVYLIADAARLRERRHGTLTEGSHGVLPSTAGRATTTSREAFRAT